MAKKKKAAIKQLPPHEFKRKICHWYYCYGCGLVALKNEVTQIAIKKGCDADDE